MNAPVDITLGEGLDLGPPLRRALIEALPIAELLSKWRDEPAVFTRRPIPADATDPMIIVNSPAAIGNADALNSERPIWMGDVAIYGTKAEPGTASDQTRTVERLGWRVRTLFHNQKFSVRPEGYSVIDIIATGPIDAPVDDDVTVGRIVSLTVRLRRDSQ